MQIETQHSPTQVQVHGLSCSISIPHLEKFHQQGVILKGILCQHILGPLHPGGFCGCTVDGGKQAG